MKDGDRFIQLAERRNKLRLLVLLFHSPELTQRDHIDWLDFEKANKN